MRTELIREMERVLELIELSSGIDGVRSQRMRFREGRGQALTR